VSVYLIRHAKAEKRSDWAQPDRLRPLNKTGHRQALGIVARFADRPLERILSSPALRCLETVDPLAACKGLAVENNEHLVEGGNLGAFVDLLTSFTGRNAVLCSHGDLIPAALETLAARGMVLRVPLRCEKGSVWILENKKAEKAGTATYWEPCELERRRVGVLDLGSTSFHVLVADAQVDGRVEPLVRERSMLRLGSVIASNAHVPEDVCERAIETARSLAQTAEHAGAETLMCVATAALREAANGPQLAQRIAEVIAAPVRVLRGEEEARVIHTAIRARLPLPTAPILALDLGGGSLEIAVDDEADVEWETTLPLGITRLHGELVRHDPMTRAESEVLRKRVRSLLSPHAPEIARRKPRLCVASGGTIRALARLQLARDPHAAERELCNVHLAVRDLEALARALLDSTHEERLRMPGMKRDRADLLPTGAVVLLAIAEVVGCDAFVVSDWGLREGMALAAVGAAKSPPFRGAERDARP